MTFLISAELNKTLPTYSETLKKAFFEEHA